MDVFLLGYDDQFVQSNQEQLLVTDLSCYRMSQYNLTKARYIENNLDSIDNEILATLEKRNALESYIYDTRKKVCQIWIVSFIQ